MTDTGALYSDLHMERKKNKAQDLSNIESKNVISFVNDELKRERTVREKSEEELKSVLVRASAVIAEYKVKAEVIANFTQGVTTHAEIINYYHKEIANLKDDIKLKESRVSPEILRIKELEEEINKLLFLYDDKNNSFGKKCNEIKFILTDLNQVVIEKKAKEVIERKKRETLEIYNQIIEIEMKVLNRERERLNRSGEIQSEVEQLEELKLSLNYLQNEKSQKEMIGLFQLLNTTLNMQEGSPENKTTETKPVEIIEGEIINTGTDA